MKESKFKFLFSISFLLLIIQSSFGQGSRYTGEYKKSDPIMYVGVKNLVIDGLEISGEGADAIVLYSCENIIIKNSKIGPSYIKRGIYLDNCKNITIIDCFFEDVVFGLLAHNSENIKFEHNDVLNITGGIYDSKLWGCMVQFDKCYGEGNSISYNVCENIPGKSSPEDIINLYMSKGTESNPILIKGNWLRGGGPSGSGGGIMLADYGGSFQIAEGNILVDPGQYGVAIAGGNDIAMKNNKVFGRQQSFTNVGIYGANWTEDFGKSYNITIEDNKVHYASRTGDKGGFWFADNIEPIKGKSTNKVDLSLSASILPDKIIGRARDNAPEVPPTDPGDGNNNGGGGEPEAPDLTPPPVDGGDKPGGGPEVDPDPDEVFDPSITIYLDRFKRICINTRGRVQRDSNVSIYNSEGQQVYSQRLRGFHTVVRKSLKSGTYDVKVRNGKKMKNQQLIIK